MEKRLYREIVTILMSSRFYFDLSIEERHALVKHLMKSSALSPEALVDAASFVDIAPHGHA
jgi:hypothetical protein